MAKTETSTGRASACSTPLDSGQRVTLARALEAHRRGDLDQAEGLYRQLLEAVPGCFDPWHLLGAAAIQRGDPRAGLELLNRAIAIDPGQANAHANVAKALLDIGDAAGALAACDRAVALSPSHAEAWYNRGNALRCLGSDTDAATSYERALALRPDYANALNNLGETLRHLGRPEAALACLNRLLAGDPAHVGALNNRGLALSDLRRSGEALADFDRALLLAPGFADALHNRGNALMDLRRPAEAALTFAQLAARAPDFMYVQGNLLHARLSSCDWQDHRSLSDLVQARVAADGRGDCPFSFLCVSDDAELQLRCARTYASDQHSARCRDRSPRRFGHERIRVAYLSGDFGEHAVSYLLAGVLERHDRTQFDTVGIAWGRQNDGAMRCRLEAAFGRFIDVTQDSDDAVALRLQEDEIDIAVDLAGHTRDNRGGIFARRAAPVQVNYLGLPATMGAEYMDYLIADRHLIPDDRRRAYAEQVVWLPDVFQPNDGCRGAAPARPRAVFGLPPSGPVLCSFNNCVKLNPAIFDVWMRVLRAAPDSVLWLLSTHPEVAANLRREAHHRGIDARRLVFAGRVPHAEYLARYACADLFLDSLPFNAGTTASDALSQGLPVLTCAGDAFAGRMSASLLWALGKAELVAHSLADYQARAIKLANEPETLANLRRDLEALRHDHVIFDAERYCRHLEAAYRTMRRHHEDGLAPAAFAVPPWTAHGFQRPVA